MKIKKTTSNWLGILGIAVLVVNAMHCNPLAPKKEEDGTGLAALAALAGSLTTVAATTATATESGFAFCTGTTCPSAEWATGGTGAANTSINGIAVDSSGNTVAAGSITGTGQFTFGTGVTVTGVASGNSPLLVKYNSFGIVQWAVSSTSGTYGGTFTAVALDSSGNIYAVGTFNGSGSSTPIAAMNFGNGVSLTAPSSNGFNTLLVKYNSAGLAQWARTYSGALGVGSASLRAVTVNSAGEVYVAGSLTSTLTYTFDTGITVTGQNALAQILLVKYTSSGAAVWARTTTAGYSSSINSLALDTSGNVFAGGFVSSGGVGSTTNTFGTGVSLTGRVNGTDIMLLKYNSSGIVQWAKSVTDGSSGSAFDSIAIDSNGNIFGVGTISGTGVNTFSTGVTATGLITGKTSPLLVKYDSSGIAQWARTITSASGGSTTPEDILFKSVAVDSTGNAYVAGKFKSPLYTFSTGVTAKTVGEMVIVKYNTSGTAQWASVTNSADTTGNDNGDVTINSIAAYSNNGIIIGGSGSGSSGARQLFGSSVSIRNNSTAFRNDAIVARYR